MEILKELVEKEAKKLRKYSTEEERSNLDIDSLWANNRRRCIYGQMTGDCFSERANSLIIKCCKQVYTGNLSNLKLNGAPHKIDLHEERGRYYFSPIEIFIFHNDKRSSGVVNLVAYLKGEIDELKL
jgi:hypothetical protein